MRRLNDLLIRYPVMIVIAIVVIYGFKPEDYRDFTILTPDPFVTHPDISRQFLHSSPLSLFIGWPLTHTIGARASYVITYTGGILFLAWSTYHYLSDKAVEQARLTLIVVLSSPIVIVLTRWFGKSDTYLLAFYLLLLRHYASQVASAILAALMVCTHKEIGTVMLVTDALLRWRARPSVIIGAIAGNGIVSLYLAWLSAKPFSRIDLNISGLRIGATNWAHNPLAHIVFTLGWFWWFILGPNRPPNAVRVAVVVMICFALDFVAADVTRVFVLCAFPLIVFTAEHVARSERLSTLAAGDILPLLFLLQMQLDDHDKIHDVSTTVVVQQALENGR